MFYITSRGDPTHCCARDTQVFEYLGMTRIYTKPKGQMPDYTAPVIIRIGLPSRRLAKNVENRFVRQRFTVKPLDFVFRA